MCISSLVEGKRPVKDRVPQRGCRGSAFPASCTGGRGGSCWQWELTLQTLTPCGHRGVLGTRQEKLYFRNCTLRLPSCPALLRWAGEWCAGRNVSRENTQLVAAIFGTVKNHWERSSSLLLSELLFCILLCPEKPSEGWLADTSKVEEMNIFGFLNNKVGKISQHFNSF